VLVGQVISKSFQEHDVGSPVVGCIWACYLSKLFLIKNPSHNLRAMQFNVVHVLEM